MQQWEEMHHYTRLDICTILIQCLSRDDISVWCQLMNVDIKLCKRELNVKFVVLIEAIYINTPFMLARYRIVHEI